MGVVKRVLLLSGGIDSIALAYWLRPKIGITIDYGQASAEKEITAAAFVAQELGIDHVVVRAGIADMGIGTMSRSEGMAISPVPEWWPFRNQFLITLAGMQAVRSECEEVIIGTVKSDRQMKDGSPVFLKQCSELLSMQEGGIRVVAPALEMNSIELVQNPKCRYPF